MVDVQAYTYRSVYRSVEAFTSFNRHAERHAFLLQVHCCLGVYIASYRTAACSFHPGSPTYYGHCLCM